MRLPDEAYAARLNEPSDEACAATPADLHLEQLPLAVRPNASRISRRKRAARESAKMPTISRAKRSDCMRVLGAGSMFDRAFDLEGIISCCVC